MTIFETERLIVRPWTDRAEDLARILDIYSRVEVVRWLGNPNPMVTLDEARAAVGRWAAIAAEDGRFGVWAMQRRDDGQALGSVLVKYLPNSDGTPPVDVEVGWNLHPDAWGNGYATEGARGAIEHAFAHGVTELFAVVRPGNEPSLAVCRRLGLTPLGRTARWYDLELEAFAKQRQ
jgi:RimJ/RimL family protein N-acetyltransferase